MNELQIRLSADITALQSALTKAKATIKSFEETTNKETQKSNLGFQRKKGIIEELTIKAKNLRTALTQATNEAQIAKYNAKLEETTTSLTRLNALGRSVTSNLGSTANGFGQVAKQGGNANGVAIEFNRVIQDAPFGLIGIGNNLQQLAGNFAQVSKSAGGTGAAIKASLSSIVSPVNLGLLAISALTAGFTAYQMGAFDSIFATDDLAKSAEDAATKLEDYRNSLDAVTRASIEGAANGEKEAQSFTNLRLQAENANIPLSTRIEAVKDLQKTFPDYLGNLTQEQILTGNVGTAYEDLTTQIIASAKARAASDAIAQNSLKLLTLENQALERSNKISALDEESKRIRATGQATSIATAAGLVRTEAGERLAKVEGEINDLIKEQITGVKELGSINSENNRLTESISKNISEGAKFTETEVGAVKELNKAFDDTLAKIELINGIKKGSGTAFNALSSGLSQGLKSELGILENELNNALSGGSSDEIEGLQTKIANVKAVLKNFATDVKDIPIEFNIIPEGGQQELGLIQQLQAQIQSINALRDVATDPTRIQAYNDQLKALQAQLALFTTIQEPLAEQNKLLLDSFSSLGIGIAASLDIGNKAFKGFITTVLSVAPKIIAALMAQSAAKKAAAAKDVATNAQVAASEGIAVAAKGANALGPVGLALLPVFIGGALALISGAFSKIGGGGNISGGGGGSAPSTSGKAPQIFTNVNTVQPPSPSSPNPSGSIDFERAQGRITTTVSGEDIVFVYERYKERQSGGG